MSMCGGWEVLFLLRNETYVSPIWMPQWRLVGWREGSFPGQLDRCRGCRPNPVPGLRQGATTGWALVTSRSWDWAPRVWTLFLHLCRHQQVCFTVEEEALTLCRDHHKTAKRKQARILCAAA
ncbi:hypothetical protein mRhiFer1_008781 [Rhinolophus ferrumequinum]|uniref:Uncharacterized protein n=1 Tax=Rhinolophus ferrumequinum TaxID=59479 RepID=A0A7J7TNB3_RHIFE|nr:hypothetical protein mRhiFer1_008781 [Rhinolophus ferrumequinum]